MFHHPLVREIAAVLILKLVIITGIWFTFFRVDHAPPFELGDSPHPALDITPVGPTNR